MGISLDLFDAAFYTGGALAGADVPGLYPVAIGGRGYMVDLKTPYSSQRFHHESIPLLRPQQDNAAELGERSLNPEQLWRRSQDAWHHGAGQTFLDRQDSDRARFRTSKGIDVWTKWQISLLPDTSSKKSTSSTNLQLVTARDKLYLSDGANIYHTTSLSGTPTWTAVTGMAGTSPVSMASDGYTVYSAHTANGIYKTDATGVATASYVTGNVTLVNYLKGRLLAAYQNSIYNPTTNGALPAALFTHGNSDFSWVGMCAGRRYIFFAGYSGDKSLIYGTTIKTDGTALDAPAVAAELPDGEIVRSIQGYLGGYVLIGTDKGIRFAQEDSANGGLQLGALISIPSAVKCFEPQDRFVWFGYTNYDSTSTGLGRIDLSVFAQPLQPAYASDLMATAQGTVTSVATFGNQRVFCVSGVGVFCESSNKVASGTIDSGLITFDLADDKVGVALDVKHSSLPTGSSYQAYVAGDDGAFTSIGIHSPTTSAEQFPINLARSQNFETRLKLNRATDTTTAPIIQRQTLKAEVTADPGNNIFVPLLIHETVTTLAGNDATRDIVADLAWIKTLREDRTIVNYQEGNQTYAVVVDDYDFWPYKLSPTRAGFEGTVICKLKIVR